METYVLTGPQPIRASAISAVLDLVGAVLIVVGLEFQLTWLTVIGIVLFAAGIALAVAAAVARRRLRVQVLLDTDDITIRTAGRSAAARWSDISGVTADKHAIYLARDDSEQPTLKIDVPRGTADPQFARLSTELAARLDSNRGYHPL